MINKTDITAGYKRIVIKIGSGLLVKEGDREDSWQLQTGKIKNLAKEIADLQASREVVLVSSGAVAAGRGVLDLKGRKLDRQEQQAAAATGQMVLSKAWGDAFAKQKKQSAQMLLTLQDTEKRSHHVNVRETLSQLLKFGVIPVINENDTVTQGVPKGEVRYGDNDRLAARIATMIRADLLILLSDIDGLYSGNPNLANPNLEQKVRHIPLVADMTPEIMAMAQDRDSILTSGGMATKLRAAEIAVKGGVDMIIADGREKDALKRLRKGARHSLFKAEMRSLRARKDWIRGSLRPKGAVMVDDGAMDAVLNKGKSLLPAGVKDIIGDFVAGEAVDVISADSVRRAVGLVAYDSHSARRIIGKRSEDVADILGKSKARRALIHRDDLVVL